jgi:hypothetical protein
MTKAYKFEFEKGITKKLIEDKISLAIRSAEHAFGLPKTRLSARYAVKNNRAIISVFNDVGEYIVRVFIGFMSEEVGECGVKFEPIEIGGPR